MVFDKITAADLEGKGVAGLPDTPQLTTAQMQAKLEEVVRDVVIPHFNRLADSADLQLADRYTKAETQRQIARKVTELGVGDMAKSVYDKNNNGVVDNAEKLGGNAPGWYMAKNVYDSQGDGTVNNARMIGGKTLNSLYGLHNKPTPAAIGAAASNHTHTPATIGAADANTHNLKTYTSLAQLGLTENASITAVANAMPNGSVFYCNSNGLKDSSWNMPREYGHIELTKASAGRYKLLFVDKDSDDILFSELDNTSGIPTGVWHILQSNAEMLWNGSWTSGKLYIPNLSKYNMLVIRTATSRNILCKVFDEAVAGGGVSYNTANGTIVTSLFLGRTNDNLTLTNFEVFKLAGGTSPTAVTSDKSIKEIWGVIR